VISLRRLTTSFESLAPLAGGKGTLATLRARLLVFVVVAFAVFGVSVAGASAAACTDSWTGAAGDGLWSSGANWSTGVVPGADDAVCLPDLGHSYAVTLAPSGGSGGGTVSSLTIGTSTGGDTETLEIVGQSYVYEGETLNGEGLGVANGATINATGSLVLDATGGGGRALGSDVLGGPAAFGDSPFGGGAAIDNYGQIIAESSDYPTWGEQLNGDVTNEPGGTITVASGSLDQQTSNTVTNLGLVSTDSGGDYDVTSGGTNDVFTNDGTVANDGSFEVQGQTGTFTQDGPVTGNAVMIESGASLADQSGSGTFTLEYGTPVLTGTIPAGQTVNVRGASDIYEGETQNGTNLSLGGAALINDGTLTLDATADGTRALPSDSVGGGVAVGDGSLTNNATLAVEDDDPAWGNVLNVSVENAHAGTATLAGTVNQAFGVNGITLTNDGTLTLTPTAVLNLYGGATLTGETDGTIVPQIAGASSFAMISVGGTMSVAGAIAPALLGGYIPPVGHEFDVIVTGNGAFHGTFEGTFGAVGAGFTVDYTNAPANPGYVGVVYQAPSPPTATVTTPVDGASYQYGSVPNAAFGCAEGAGGSGIASCTASVDGTPITAGAGLPGSLGPHTITVTALSNDGLSAQTVASYTVIQATTIMTAEPQLIFTKPLSGAGLFMVNATLLSTGGVPVAGATVRFTSGKTALCTAVTTSAGDASCKIGLIPELIVLLSDRYTATFAGTSDDAATTTTTVAYTKAPHGARIKESLMRAGKAVIWTGSHTTHPSLARVRHLKAGRYSLALTVSGHRITQRSIRLR
jgi:hypothetical protein